MSKTEIQVGATEGLTHIWNNVNEKTKEFIARGYMFYREQYKKLRKQHNPESVAYNFGEEVSRDTERFIKENNYNISCRRGCSFCCKINVDITEDEALMLMDVVKEKNIKINYDRLEKQKTKELSSWKELSNEDRTCIFLDETKGECTIYEYRPMVCRKHVVISKPEDCDLESGVKEIGRLNNVAVELIISAVMSESKTDSMARQLLKIKESEAAINGI